MDVLEKAMTGNIELRARVNALVDAMKDVNRNAGETDGEVRRFLSSLRGSARGGVRPGGGLRSPRVPLVKPRHRLKRRTGPRPASPLRPQRRSCDAQRHAEGCICVSARTVRCRKSLWRVEGCARRGPSLASLRPATLDLSLSCARSLALALLRSRSLARSLSRELPEDYEEFLLARFNGAEASVESDPDFRTLRKITKVRARAAVRERRASFPRAVTEPKGGREGGRARRAPRHHRARTCRGGEERGACWR
jgi:hypothetical protein